MTTPRIHDLFDLRLQRDPHRPFLVLPQPGGGLHTLSYAEVDGMVALLQEEFDAAGVRPGDRVLVVAENCPEHVALVLACSRSGAWACGVNGRMAAGEVAAFAAKADARLTYFTSGISAAAAAHARSFGAVAAALPGLERSPPRLQAVAQEGPLAQEVAAIIFTSGTTGTPKGVMMTHAGVTHFGRVSAESRALGADDRSYAYLPMTHIFGLGTVLVASMHAGATLLMRSAFDPADALLDLARHGVTQLQGPPALFSRLLAHAEQQGIRQPAAPALRYVYTGAGPLDLALKQRVEAAFGQALHHGYGLSEYAGSLYVTRLHAWRQDTSAGHPLPGAELRIVDPATGRDLPAGERGEIWMRGVGLMPGYFRDPEATAAVMRPGGWYASGDIGALQDDGALFVLGRLKEMIIRSGFNVYPAEVEAALNAFPAISQSAVVGQAAGDGNEDIVAFVQLRHGQALDEAALRGWLRGQLAAYKQPARVHVVDAFPMAGSGKVLKRQLLQDHPAA